MEILALQLKRIGDLILTTPALAAIKQRFPQARLTLAAPAAAREILPALDYVDRALVFGKSLADLRGWAVVTARHFDAVLDFTGNDRSALATFLSGAPTRAAFAERPGFRRRAYTQTIDSPVRDRHTIDHYLDLLAALGISAPLEPSVALHLPESARVAADRALAIDEDFAIIHPGTARPEKYWLPERWAAVIDHLQSAGLPCFLTGGRHPFETAHLAQIAAALRTPHRSLAGELDLLTFAAVARRARLFLSVDSGPMHIASAFQTPQAALFGPTNPFHWRPRHRDALILLAGQSEPVENFTPRHLPAPLSEISTEQVIRATHILLDRDPSRF